MRVCAFAAVAPRPLPTFQALYSLVSPMLPLPLQCSSSRPWIRPADRPGSRVWGKMRVRAAWQVAVAMVLVWGWGVEAQLSGGEAAAMQVLREKLQIGADAWQPEEDPCGLWRGVMCSNGHVDAVLLTGLPQTGGNPSLGEAWALSQLPFLRVFNASQFTFSGGIPGWFGNVVSLESLDLTGCSLSGALPENFGALSRLKTLSLAGNKLSGTVPASFGNFSGLAFLNLSMNAFVGAVPALNSGVLTVVDFSWNKLSEGVGPLLSGVPNLEFLDLSRNRLTLPVPWELGNLKNLHYLDVSRNDISGSLPPELGRLANLTVARFSYNNFSGALPAELTGWSGCRVMELDHNEFSGDIPATIGLLQNLVVLDVSQNNFKGVYSRGLLSLPMLQALNLSRNLFYGPLPQELAAHQTLVTLDISENFFNGTVPMGFLPSAITRKNCLAQVDKQRPLRACTKFYAPMGVTFSFNATPPIDNTNAAAPPPPYSTSPLENPPGQQSSTGSNLAPLLAGVFGGMALILFVGVMVFCLHRCQMRRSRDRAMDSGRVSAVGGRGQTFTYSQLASATSKFSLSNLICVGHSGDLYRGEMSGTAVVVKKVDLRRVKRDLYLSELEVFDKASHTKLVSLLGTCLDREEEKYLVYKYCPNNDLASSLHKKGSSVHSDDVLQSLDWITRLKIAIGVADGLSYLHSECSPPIIHRDVRASSILLDDKYEVRIGSLGDASIQDSDSHPNILSRMFGLSSSSYDPADPSHGIATSTYDVYCFGKVLLELVSGKLGISGTTNNQWLDWALPLINVNDKEGLPKIVDPSLIVDEDLIEEVWAMAIIAKACLNSKPSKRPSMKHVLKALENPHKVVREENFGESLAVRSSSRSSWNEVLFGSFRHHNSVSGYFRGGGVGTSNNNGNSSGNEDNYPASMPIARPGMLASSSSQNSREMYAMNHHIRHGSCDIAREPIVEVAHESDDDQLRR